MDWKNIFKRRGSHTPSSVVIVTPRASVSRHSDNRRRAPRSQQVTDVQIDQIASLDRLLEAWRKVKANHGSAGVDGVTIQAYERNLRANLEQLAEALKHGRYHPQPVKRIYVPKPSGGARPLAILAVEDRIVQRALYDLIAPRFERQFLDCSFGFREGRSTQDAVRRIVELRQRGLRWVVDGDIKNCFEAIDHARLMRMIHAEVRDTGILRLIEAWLKARVLNELERRDLSVGTFQGGVLSPLLANIYLHTFDVALTQARYDLVRYADDWLILCSSQRNAQAALSAAIRALDELQLAINPYKTRVVNFDQGFKFVGTFFVRDEHFDLSPSSSFNGDGFNSR
jgi:RNA-directed DNA polymerase